MSRKKKSSKLIFFAAVILIVLVILGWIGRSEPLTNSDSANIRTLSQGTQMHFDDLFIGLASVSGKSAWLIINKQGQTNSERRQVMAGDKVDIYGYTILVKSINASFNLSVLPGSSHGSVQLDINKD
jgi:hypothetical protein